MTSANPIEQATKEDVDSEDELAIEEAEDEATTEEKEA